MDDELIADPRSLSMRTLLLSSLAFATTTIAGCGDNLIPDQDDNGKSADDTPKSEDDHPPSPEGRQIDGFIEFSNPDCDRASLGVKAVLNYTDDGSEATDVDCIYTFDDGGTEASCDAVHVFQLAGGAEVREVRLIARDRATGARIELADSSIVYREMMLDATVVTPECGLEIDYGYEFFAPATDTVVLVEPADKVVAMPPGEGRIVVSEPGDYSVTVRMEQERTAGPICVAEETNVVHVACACPQ
jgi:hypothetical protein